MAEIANERSKAGGVKTGDSRSPNATVLPEAKVPQGVPGGVWEVKSGDTLSGIAQKVYGDAKKWTDIVSANPGLTPKIRPGDRIPLPVLGEGAGAEPSNGANAKAQEIPLSRLHVVRPGENLSMVAEKKLGASKEREQIAKINTLPNPDRIAVGESLLLPELTPEQAARLKQPDPRTTVIQKGDSLSAIAKREYGDTKYYKEIIQANPGLEGKLKSLPVGLKITLPKIEVQGTCPVSSQDLLLGSKEAPSEWTVKKGDTLGTIAKEVYGSADLWTLIRDANNCDPGKLEPGMKLTIPKREIPSASVSFPEGLEARYSGIMVDKPGFAYGSHLIKSHSHYLEPIDTTEGRLCGRSRVWGDASIDTQSKVIYAVESACKAKGFNSAETAFAMALVRCESGFNPDAAAATTSASGVFQLIDDTRATLCSREGIKNVGPFCMATSLTCGMEALREMFAFARSKGASPGSDRYFQLAYAYHHDGPSLKHGGQEIAAKSVLPVMRQALKAIAE